MWFVVIFHLGFTQPAVFSSAVTSGTEFQLTPNEVIATISWIYAANSASRSWSLQGFDQASSTWTTLISFDSDIGCTADVCMNPQQYALTNNANSCQSCNGSIDQGLVHWFRFEDSSTLNFDSVAGIGVGDLIQRTSSPNVNGFLLSDASPGNALNLESQSGTDPEFEISTDIFDKSWTLSFAFQILSTSESYGRLLIIDEFLEISLKKSGTRQLRVFFFPGKHLLGDANDRKELLYFCSADQTQKIPYGTFFFATITGEYNSASKNLNINVFCNGQKEGSFSLQEPYIGTKFIFGTNRVEGEWKGGRTPTDTDADGDLILDDLRLYNRVLTDTEIQVLADQSQVSNGEVTPCLCQGQIAAPGSCSKCPLAISSTYNQYKLVSTTAVQLNVLKFLDADGNEIPISSQPS